MGVLFNYGNAIFWIGLLLVVFLAVCEFMFNNLNVTLSQYKILHFEKHPRWQKFCRAVYVVTLILALFAQVGFYWQSDSVSVWDYLANVLIVLFTYYVACYSFIICMLWALTFLWRMLRLFFAAVEWIAKYIMDWVTAE